MKKFKKNYFYLQKKFFSLSKFYIDYFFSIIFIFYNFLNFSFLITVKKFF